MQAFRTCPEIREQKPQAQSKDIDVGANLGYLQAALQLPSGRCPEPADEHTPQSPAS